MYPAASSCRAPRAARASRWHGCIRRRLNGGTRIRDGSARCWICPYHVPRSPCVVNRHTRDVLQRRPPRDHPSPRIAVARGQDLGRGHVTQLDPVVQPLAHQGQPVLEPDVLARIAEVLIPRSTRVRRRVGPNPRVRSAGLRRARPGRAGNRARTPRPPEESEQLPETPKHPLAVASDVHQELRLRHPNRYSATLLVVAAHRVADALGELSSCPSSSGRNASRCTVAPGNRLANSFAVCTAARRTTARRPPPARTQTPAASSHRPAAAAAETAALSTVGATRQARGEPTAASGARP
jgi:hypothetical protein